MDSKPNYDTWYAPIDPIKIGCLGLFLVVVTWMVVSVARYIINNPSLLVKATYGVGILVGVYVLGLVAFHIIERIR